MGVQIYDPLLEIKFFGCHHLSLYLLNKININSKKIIWYRALSMSIFVYLHRVDFEYDIDYLISSQQKYPQITQLKKCLIIYLIEDLLFNSTNDSIMILHHIESISGLIFGLLGYFVGGTNNTVLNEISSVWLCLFNICKDSPYYQIKKISLGFIIIFIFSFVNNRIIPMSKMNYILFSNLSMIQTHFSKLNISIAICLSVIHTSIQYYWLKLLMTKIIKKVK